MQSNPQKEPRMDSNIDELLLNDEVYQAAGCQ